jgi:S-formylglutathione hydrolase FrmB
MRTIIEAAQPDSGSPVLLALLSGSYSEPEDFVREGFAREARARGVGAELAMAEVRAAWFADGSIVRRIRDNVVKPAQARGRSRIWLAGISIGGLAALCYAARHEIDIEGILLISPYPATRDVLRDIDAAGGLEAWRPVIPPEGDLEREAWRWLADSVDARPEVHCYFTSGDRFVAGQRRMASAVDPRHVRELPGIHDWDAWRALWGAFLAERATVLQ